jgi:hypothetical protein
MDPAKLTRQEAEDALRQYVESEEDRLRWFEAKLVEAGGEPDYTRESLRAAGVLVRDRLRPPAGQPMPFEHLGDEGRQLIDGVAAYFAACLRRRHPQLGWRLDTYPKSAFYQRPILAGVPGFELYPPTPVATRLLAAWSEEPQDDDWLVKLFDGWAGRLHRPKAVAMPIDDIDVVRIEDDPEWDVEIWIPEYAEQALGDAEYQRLPVRLGRVPGIRKLAWEDRERFLARVEKDTELDEVKSSIAEAMRQAAAAGHSERD